MKRWVFRIAVVAAVLFASLAAPISAQADVSGTWTNTGPLAGSDCPVTWSGQSSYSLQQTSILKITQASGQAGCSLTIKSEDLSTWQISLDQGVSWTTLFGSFEGISASGGSFPRQVWFRVGSTSATIGSGNYVPSLYGSDFQVPVISINPILLKGSVEMTFWLPDGRECTNISPVRVPIDSQYILPSPGADCRTTSGAEILGWKVGWDDLIHPPGHPVLVVDSQQFTAVIKEESLTVNYDANVGAGDQCFVGAIDLPVKSRTISQEIDRDDLAQYRVMVEPACAPAWHSFAGWNWRYWDTRPSAELLTLGAPAPADWSTTGANQVTLYAQWKPRPPVVVDINAFPTEIPQLTPVSVVVGNAIPAAGAGPDGYVTITGPSPPELSFASPAMTKAIEDFFLSGGTSLVIIPATDAEGPGLAMAIDSINVPNALDLSAPEMRGLSGQSYELVAAALIEQASELEAMAWLDPPASVVAGGQPAQAVNGVIALAEQLRAVIDGDDVSATLLGSGVVAADGTARAASPAALGTRVRTDTDFGIWVRMQPLAGAAITGSEVNSTQSQQAQMQINGVSPVIDFPMLGTVIAPNITLDRLVHTTQQRFDDWLFQSLKMGLSGFKDLPNGPETWAAMTEDIASFLNVLYQEGALSGNSPAQAFQIDCSATQQAIEEGYVTCDMTLQFLMPPPREFTLQVPVQPGVTSQNTPVTPVPSPALPSPNSASPNSTPRVPSIVP